jgi:hypothetical protein
MDLDWHIVSPRNSLFPRNPIFHMKRNRSNGRNAQPMVIPAIWEADSFPSWTSKSVYRRHQDVIFWQMWRDKIYLSWNKIKKKVFFLFTWSYRNGRYKRSIQSGYIEILCQPRKNEFPMDGHPQLQGTFLSTLHLYFWPSLLCWNPSVSSHPVKRMSTLHDGNC